MKDTPASSCVTIAKINQNYDTPKFLSRKIERKKEFEAKKSEKTGCVRTQMLCNIFLHLFTRTKVRTFAAS